MEDERIIVRSAIPADVVFADQIIHEMESSAIARGSGTSKPGTMKNLSRTAALSYPLNTVTRVLPPKSKHKYLNYPERSTLQRRYLVLPRAWPS
jgi:hypothetical protein